MKHPNDMKKILDTDARVQKVMNEIEGRNVNDDEQSFISNVFLAEIMKKTYLAWSMILMSMCDSNILMFSDGKTHDLDVFCIPLPCEFPHTLCGITLLGQSYVRMFCQDMNDAPCLMLRMHFGTVEEEELLPLVFAFACLNTCYESENEKNTVMLFRGKKLKLRDFETSFESNTNFDNLPSDNLSLLVCFSV